MNKGSHLAAFYNDRMSHKRPTLESLSRDVAALAQSVHCSQHLLEKIMATQAELTTQVQAIGATLTKIGTETTALLAKIDELNAVIAAGTVTPELQAAVDAVAAQAHVVDDLVPDTGK
jgi:septal ring factor EnvC (AmiA/AmiB activator)